MNYILNSKNRKLKTKVIHLTSRLTFWLSHIGILEKYIVLSVCLLVISLFFPWFQALVTIGKSLHPYYVWDNGYTGIILQLVILVSGIVCFFIFSNSRKERFRPYMFLGVTDGQLYLILSVLLFVILLDIHRYTIVFLQFASGGIETKSGYILALIGTINLWIWWYLFHRSEQRESRDLAYIDRNNNYEFDDYKEILGQSSPINNSSQPKKDKKNMSLPI